MKKIIIAVVITAIFCIGGTVVATNLISAEQVNYNENTTVKDKIDDLYTTAQKFSQSETEFAIEAGQHFYFFPINNSSRYKYFRVHAIPGSGATCSMAIYDIITKKYDIQFDTDYITANNEGFQQRRVRLQASGSYCTFTLSFHN